MNESLLHIANKLHEHNWTARGKWAKKKYPRLPDNVFLLFCFYHHIKIINARADFIMYFLSFLQWFELPGFDGALGRYRFATKNALHSGFWVCRRDWGNRWGRRRFCCWWPCCCFARVQGLGWVVRRSNKVRIQIARWAVIPRCCRNYHELLGCSYFGLWPAVCATRKVLVVALRCWRSGEFLFLYCWGQF